MRVHIQLQLPEYFAGSTANLADGVRRELMAPQGVQDMLGFPA
jgi:hypothetical protein